MNEELNELMTMIVNVQAKMLVILKRLEADKPAGVESETALREEPTEPPPMPMPDWQGIRNAQACQSYWKQQMPPRDFASELEAIAAGIAALEINDDEAVCQLLKVAIAMRAAKDTK